MFHLIEKMQSIHLHYVKKGLDWRQERQVPGHPKYSSEISPKRRLRYWNYG